MAFKPVALLLFKTKNILMKHFTVIKNTLTKYYFESFCHLIIYKLRSSNTVLIRIILRTKICIENTSKVYSKLQK